MCITILCVPLQYQNKQTMKTSKAIYENLRKFEVEFTFSEIGNIATIKENGVNVWELYANTEKSLRAKTTKWIKENWI